MCINMYTQALFGSIQSGLRPQWEDDPQTKTIAHVLFLLRVSQSSGLMNLSNLFGLLPSIGIKKYIQEWMKCASATSSDKYVHKSLNPSIHTLIIFSKLFAQSTNTLDRLVTIKRCVLHCSSLSSGLWETLPPAFRLPLFRSLRVHEALLQVLLQPNRTSPAGDYSRCH